MLYGRMTMRCLVSFCISLFKGTKIGGWYAMAQLAFQSMASIITTSVRSFVRNMCFRGRGVVSFLC